MKRKFQIPTEVQNTLKGHKGSIYVVRYNIDASYYFSGSSDRTIMLWNPLKSDFIKIYHGAHNYELLDICITKDKSRFATVGGDKTGFLWDVKTGAIIRKFKGHNHKLTCC